MQPFEKSGYKYIEEWIYAAREEAWKRGIEANTIVINKNLSFVKEFVLKDPYFTGLVSTLPPMIMGMEILVAEMPRNQSFLIFHSLQTERDKEIARIRKDTAKEILDRVQELFGGVWIEELYAKYGIEME